METNKTIVWPIRMPKKLKDEFKAYCDCNGFSMNKKINILIKECLNNEKISN